MDFAENYALYQQDECQSIHWNNNQVTIHPIVNYYHDDDAIITHEVVYIPSDLQHDSIAGTLGCVFIDNETHESGVTKCTTGEAWSAFSWHHSSVFHCQWTHNQVFLLLSQMLI